MKKLLSIRIRNSFRNKGTKTPKKYYKSCIQQMKHDLRKEEMTNGYLKHPEKGIKILYGHNNLNNKYLVELEKKVDTDYLKYHKQRTQKTMKKFSSGLITFSKSFNEDHNENYDKKIKEFIKQRFKDTIYIVIHNDETTKHYHFQYLNYDFNTHKSISKNINTSKLQDELDEFLGSEYKRGIKQVKPSKHLDILQSKIIEKERELERLNTLIEERKQRVLKEIQDKRYELKKEQVINKNLINVLNLLYRKINSINEEKKTINELKLQKSYNKLDKESKFKYDEFSSDLEL